MGDVVAAAGGEGNGGVIWPKVCWVRDSLSGMALVLELLATQKRALSVIAAEIPRFAMVKRKLELGAIGGAAAVAPALAKVKAAFAAVAPEWRQESRTMGEWSDVLLMRP